MPRGVIVHIGHRNDYVMIDEAPGDFMSLASAVLTERFGVPASKINISKQGFRGNHELIAQIMLNQTTDAVAELKHTAQTNGFAYEEWPA